MVQVQAFPAIWYVCPTCGEGNTLRYSFPDGRWHEGICHQCHARWTFDSMAEETVRVNGFNPFPTDHWRPATDFICDDCGRNNTVLSNVMRQEMLAKDGMIYAVQEIEEDDEAKCKFCGA